LTRIESSRRLNKYVINKNYLYRIETQDIRDTSAAISDY
jgi:hypothetical protein